MKARFIESLALVAIITAGAAFAELPDKWVSYVESTGGQYVDTCITGRWNTKIETKVEWMNIADSGFIGCGDWQKNERVFLCYSISALGEMGLSMGVNANVQYSSGWNARFEKGRIYDYTAMFSATNGAGQCTGSVTVDGLGPWTKTCTALNSGRSLYVFANNKSEGVVNGWSKTRCYGLKIFQGPEDGGDMVLVRDFRPCMKGGRAGLYDDVSKTIFYSKSETDLICDENSEVPDEYIEYVESQGDEIKPGSANGQRPAYLDTGIIGKSGTKMSGEFAILKSEDQSILDSRSGNSRFYMLHSYNSKLTCGYGDHKANNLTLQLGQKYWVETELNAGKQTQKIVVNGVTNTVLNATDSQSIDTGYSLYLFAINKDGQPDWYSKARCYGFKIWQNEVLVRDFRPCLKNGVPGLYDDVSKRIFYSLGTPFVYNNVCRQSVKPNEVVYVEYIESDGNNTLDTGVPARSGLRAKGKMAWMTEGDYGDGQLRVWNHENFRYLEETAAVFWRQKRAYLGSWKVNSGESGRYHLIHESDSRLKSHYCGSGELNAQVGGTNVVLYATTNYTFDVSYDDGSQTMEWDGVQVLNSSVAGTVDTGNNLCLFSSGYWRWRSAARCYGLEIYQSGTLVRNFKPCLVDGKGMLYDTVTESIYRPSPDIPASRTGKIILSGEEKPVQYVQYVETDGKQFIDTGVIGKAGTTAEFKETSLCTTTEIEECFLGSYGGGSTKDESRFYMWYHAWTYTAGIGYGVYWRPTKNDPYAIASGSTDPNAYKLYQNDTTHARVSLADGSQTFYTIDDATGTETLRSSRTITGDINTGRTMYLFAKNDNDAGTPKDLAKSRFYFLKIWQGNSDGTGMQLVRYYRPVRLNNGLVVLWDFKNNVPYCPKSTTAPYNDTTFPVVGPDGAEIMDGFLMLVR
ncbi:MAG: hypothetical protein K6G91_01455 [Kiritimatiellae bacterium]|nr:hypothetical protein [Kiritimatiellia bacterium]